MLYCDCTVSVLLWVLTIWLIEDQISILVGQSPIRGQVSNWLTHDLALTYVSSIDLQWHYTSRFLDLIILHNASDLGNLFDGFQTFK